MNHETRTRAHALAQACEYDTRLEGRAYAQAHRLRELIEQDARLVREGLFIRVRITDRQVADMLQSFHPRSAGPVTVHVHDQRVATGVLLGCERLTHDVYELAFEPDGFQITPYRPRSASRHTYCERCRMPHDTSLHPKCDSCRRDGLDSMPGHGAG